MKHEAIQAVIFDLDGVICHTDSFHYLAWKKIADSIGVPFDEKDNSRLRGASRMDSLNFILEKSTRAFSEAEKAALAEEKNGIYRSYLATMGPEDLSDEVRETLAYLRSAGYKLAIGSSSKNTKFILDRLGLGDFFDAVSDGTNIKRAKPDPEVFLKAAEFLGLSPKGSLVVEDATAGIDAAVSGGFYSAGIGEAALHPKVSYPLERVSDLQKIL